MFANTHTAGTEGLAKSVLRSRVLVAVVQAAALYALSDAAAAPRSWPATQAALFTPLLLVFGYVPALVLLGLGQIRGRTLAAWAAIAAIVLAGLGCHDVLRGRMPDYAGTDELWPSAHLWTTLTVGFFVAHVLVVDSIIERRLICPYPRHFDTAWKLGVQACLAIAFVGVFWAVLILGAGLFKLIEIDLFTRLIEKRWFVFPATTLALAVSIHVTDVQPALIRGTRSVVLTLFSWLLPLLAAILLGFLASLPFISLAPLWKTHFACALLLFAAVQLVFFINSCYQDGAAEKSTSRIKRISATAGALELAPIVALAAWALALRVGQYGWTSERILAAAVIAVAACYAIGYAVAVVRSPGWMKRLEITNLAAAYLFLALVLALFSPVLDPARLMVASQMGRLRSGTVGADKFDFKALRFEGARWGTAALEQLSQTRVGPDAEVIAARAKEALALTSRYGGILRGEPQPTPAEMLKRITVFPAQRTLPLQFLDDVFVKLDELRRPHCPAGQGARCLARFVSLGPDLPEALVFVDSYSVGYLFEQDSVGHWQKSGQLQGNFSCSGWRDDFERGDIGVKPHAWPDLVLGRHTVEIHAVPGGCQD